MAKQEIYVSVDIEADGPIPGEYSMLSLGAAAFSPSGEMIGTFSRNLETLPGASQDEDTMRWWASQEAAWAACRSDLVDPKEAIGDFVSWSMSHDGRPVFVAYPAGFDFTFVYWYIKKFHKGRNPFSFAALDLKSYAMCALGSEFHASSKKNFPKEWFSGGKAHTHVAVEDAIEQGMMFFRMKSWRDREFQKGL